MLAVDTDIQDIWRQYKKNPSRELRNILIQQYLPIVRFNAERVHAKLPTEVELDDLISAGAFGLMDAIEAFDMERGVKFETYCSPRVRGAILDELRSMDWVPRLVRNRSQKIQQATKELQGELGRLPTQKEVAQKIGVSAAEFDRMSRDSNAVSMTSLSRKAYGNDSSRELTEIDVVRDERASSPQQEVQKADLKRLIQQGLTSTERLILILYYYEEMTMKEIGLTLDLSESRVSQMHSAIVDRLRFQLRQRDKEFRV
ncbi:MAG: FliA/WhiG family RNA polymerase sigma factor [Planctomycetia bacterium]|jgi:RNA polymerase sigma factor for flagellar operon FliA|nr:FliA/WhiG family RNA polymerase sigma factor [Planctomycetia bacterium]MCC7314928.1 FliA/WhiG family RNA polymerase sigma factor [Planctomycetota bacterium]OQZ05855.1 MAG: FliA/WhiG family RNA polymerase sigma factor [Planctomycetes bacterium UTPLA1]